MIKAMGASWQGERLQARRQADARGLGRSTRASVALRLRIGLVRFYTEEAYDRVTLGIE